LLALDARVASVFIGAGAAAVDELPLETVLSPCDRANGARLLLSVTTPKRPRSSFIKFPTRLGFGRSLVCVGMAVAGGRVRVTLGGLRERPFHAAESSLAVERGATPTEALARECRPPHDQCASPQYRLRLAETLIARLYEKLR
jgi:CO/xanthine dehydrogenase FAD-binding subunit